MTTAAVIQDFHKEIKARAPADGPEPHSSTLRDLCVHVHVVFICTIGTQTACMYVCFHVCVMEATFSALCHASSAHNKTHGPTTRQTT